MKKHKRTNYPGFRPYSYVLRLHQYLPFCARVDIVVLRTWFVWPSFADVNLFFPLYFILFECDLLANFWFEVLR